MKTLSTRVRSPQIHTIGMSNSQIIHQYRTFDYHGTMQSKTNDATLAYCDTSVNL